jgi:hypothetical protein
MGIIPDPDTSLTSEKAVINGCSSYLRGTQSSDGVLTHDIKLTLATNAPSVEHATAVTHAY